MLLLFLVFLFCNIFFLYNFLSLHTFFVHLIKINFSFFLRFSHVLSQNSQKFTFHNYFIHTKMHVFFIIVFRKYIEMSVPCEWTEHRKVFSIIFPFLILYNFEANFHIFCSAQNKNQSSFLCLAWSFQFIDPLTGRRLTTNRHIQLHYFWIRVIWFLGSVGLKTEVGNNFCSNHFPNESINISFLFSSFVSFFF